MTELELLKCAHTLVHTMKGTLARTQRIRPVFILISERHCDYVPFDSKLLNSDEGKTAITSYLRRRAQRDNAVAALIGMDSYVFIPDIPAMRQANRRLVKAASEAGIDALIAAGFGRRCEAISVTLQTVSFHILLEQLYTRGAGGHIAFEDLLTVDSRLLGNHRALSGGTFDVFPLDRPAFR